jgi:hypothetical protein
MYIALGIVAILVILVLTGRKSVHHEISIQASPDKVWEVLTDTDSYDSWNPVMKLLEGEIKEGNKVTYRFTQDAENVSEIASRVKKVIPNQLLNQGGGIPLVLTFDHKYMLEPSGAGTKMTIHEDYRGIGVNFWNPAPVEKAYARLNEALKARVEK